MKIELEFDFEAKMIYVPDGYIKNLKTFRLDFFHWMYDQDEYVTEFGGYEYDERAVLKYINEVMLACSDEKAYLLDETDKDGKVFGRIAF